MLTWGIIGTGRIASIFAKGLLASQTGKLVAIASRSQAEADKFGISKHGDFLQSHPGVKRYGSYEALLADPQVQTVYIATPHPIHAQWAIAAAEAKKHVLCEKPIGINHAEAMTIFEAARANGVACMEAFMYRCHPLMGKVLELVRSGAIGQVRAIQANFGFNAGSNWESRLLANSLAGGGILDVGCYPISFARAVAGAALGLDGPAEPVEFKTSGTLTPTGVDAVSFATARFAAPWGGIVASLGTAVQANLENTARVYGSEGSIAMARWVPGESGNSLMLTTKGKIEEVRVEDSPNAYTLEADILAATVAAGRLEARFPAMSWHDTLGNMKLLDAWRQQIGVIYEAETPEKQGTISGKPLARRADAALPYGTLDGVGKPVARLVMGVDNQRIDQFPHAAAMFDDYFARGGNAFDTAFIYGGGKCEQALGAWIKSRNVREQVVILGKGAHTPDCNPAALTRQLLISLDRLQTEYLDIYMLHRDNLDVPVGEFVDVLNEHCQAGRIRAFGGSNWTCQRVAAFNEQARKKGLRPMTAISNNLALARMVAPIWPGCQTANDPAFLEWHTRTQMPLMPWSSQARGFFTVGDPKNTADAELVRCWYSQDNFRRQQRCRELAAQKGCTPLQLALAWVLNQPFPTFPLIGPRSIEETRTSMEALQVKLTADEVKWLNLG